MKRLNGLLLCISCLLPALFYPSVACGPLWLPDQNRVSLFRPGTSLSSGMQPFYYSERLLHSTVPDPADNDRRRNCEEWQGFTNAGIPLLHIAEIQYRTDPDKWLHACNENDWQAFDGNGFVQWLLLPENRDAFDYLRLAKEIEFTQSGLTDPWDDGNDREMKRRLASFARECLKRSTGAEKAFLRDRYLFQAMKCAHYVADPDFASAQLFPLFDRWMPRNESVVTGWAHLFRGLLERDSLQRAVHLLQAFERSDEKKLVVYNRFDMEQLERLAVAGLDTKSLEVVTVLKALKSPGRALDKLQQLQRITPLSTYLPALIAREINKLEDWLWTPEQVGLPSWMRAATQTEEEMSEDLEFEDARRKNLAKDHAYLLEVMQFVRSSAFGSRQARSFYTLAEAHLLSMGGDFAGAYRLLQGLAPLTSREQEMQRLIGLTVATAELRDVRDDAIQLQLHDYLTELMRLNPDFALYEPQIISDEYWYDAIGEVYDEQGDDVRELLLWLGHRFLLAGDIMTAGLLYNKAGLETEYYDGWYTFQSEEANYRSIAFYDRFATPETIDSLLAFRQMPKRTAFQAFITPSAWPLADWYRDLKGTLLIREHRFREALAVFSSMDPAFWQKQYAFADYLPTGSITDLGGIIPWRKPSADKRERVSKMEITKAMVQLENDMARNPMDGQTHKAYADALLNLTYWGNAWMMYSYGKSDNERYWNAYHDGGSIRLHGFRSVSERDYYFCEAAIAYYKKVLSLSKDDELTADALMMLDYCKRLTSEERGDNVQSDYLAALKSDFSHTRLWKAFKSSCLQ